MLNDLEESKILVGKTVPEVEEILGPPDSAVWSRHPDLNRSTWYVSGWSALSNYDLFLNLIVDGSGRVAGFNIIPEK